MKQEWRIVQEYRTSRLERLWILNGIWRPTERYRWTGLAIPFAPIGGGAPDTVDKYVAASGDDGAVDHYLGQDEFSSDGDYLRPGIWEGQWGEVHAWNRWTGVTIGGTITTSWVKIYSGGAIGTPDVGIYGVDEADADAPTSHAEFDADPLTDAHVNWSPWPGTGWATSPSLNSIFQELVDSYTMQNVAVMLQFRNQKASGEHYGQQWAWDKDPDGTYAAELYIEFTPRIPRSPGYGIDPMIF